jgi:hypothetical protein
MHIFLIASLHLSLQALLCHSQPDTDDDTDGAHYVMYTQEASGVLLTDRHYNGWSALLKLCLPAGRFLADFRRARHIQQHRNISSCARKVHV